jgi:hypothetical protein
VPVYAWLILRVRWNAANEHTDSENDCRKC